MEAMFQQYRHKFDKKTRRIQEAFKARQVAFARTVLGGGNLDALCAHAQSIPTPAVHSHDDVQSELDQDVMVGQEWPCKPEQAWYKVSEPSVTDSPPESLSVVDDVNPLHFTSSEGSSGFTTASEAGAVVQPDSNTPHRVHASTEIEPIIDTGSTAALDNLLYLPRSDNVLDAQFLNALGDEIDCLTDKCIRNAAPIVAPAAHPAPLPLPLGLLVTAPQMNWRSIVSHDGLMDQAVDSITRHLKRKAKAVARKPRVLAAKLRKAGQAVAKAPKAAAAHAKSRLIHPVKACFSAGQEAEVDKHGADVVPNTIVHDPRTDDVQPNFVEDPQIDAVTDLELAAAGGGGVTSCATSKLDDLLYLPFSDSILNAQFMAALAVDMDALTSRCLNRATIGMPNESGPPPPLPTAVAPIDWRTIVSQDNLMDKAVRGVARMFARASKRRT